jgi:hypothetical protein
VEGRAPRRVVPDVADEHLAVGRWRDVARVRIAVVEPQEERGGVAGAAAQPGERGVAHGLRLLLRVIAPDLDVALEALGEAVLARQVGVGGDGVGGVAGFAQRLGRGAVVLGEDAARHVQAVAADVQTGEQRGDARRGLGELRHGVREAQPARRQSVELRRGRARIAVAAQVVGAQRVGGDQQQVGTRAGVGVRRTAPAAGDQQRRNESGRRRRPQASSRSGIRIHSSR